MFRCVCYTCETRDGYESWDDAQETFNEHARDLHEVVLVRATPVEGEPDSDSIDGATDSRAATGSDTQTAAKSDSNGRNPMDG
ncbi:hypothetical protein [Halosimplex sp. J119]